LSTSQDNVRCESPTLDAVVLLLLLLALMPLAVEQSTAINNCLSLAG